jgi:hypothetical protein
MKTVLQYFLFSLIVFPTWVGCSEKPAPKPTEESLKLPAESAKVVPTPPSETPATEPEKTAPPEPARKKKTAAFEKEILLAYFGHLSAGRMEEAHQLELRTQVDCKKFMVNDRCEAMLEGQIALQNELAKDPVPHNSALIEFASGQEQQVGPDRGFQEGTTLWLGSTIRARGPAGNEFHMKSLGLLINQDDYKIIWGKRRTFGDTPRNPKNKSQ